MKKLIVLFPFLFGLTFLWAQLVQPFNMSNDLWEQIKAHPGAQHEIRILLQDRVDVEAMDEGFYQQKASIKLRTQTLIQSLQAKAAATQGPLLEVLRQSPKADPKSIQALWITNLIQVSAEMSLIYDLCKHPDVDWVEWNAPAEPDDFEVVATAPMMPNSHEPGHDAINAPAMWALGYTGYNQVALIIDTGVDGEHPALKGKYRGNYVPGNQAWFSPFGSTTPQNCGNHGSHVAGTIVGLDPATQDTIGVAVDGQWMGAQGICGGGGTTLALQWALNPDGDPTTIDDMPDVINNSWFSGDGGSQECNGAYKPILDALEAAGVAVVFSAGNAGPNSMTITGPKNISTNLVNVFCVANVNGAISPLFPIRNSSSRGPSFCGGTGSLLIKPEVAAPGSNVRSSVLAGGYASFTGTSMAAPHAAGAILLLKEAFPNLTGTELKLALYNSCVDLGTPGEDNDYGMGIIDVLAAYNYLIAQGNTPFIPSRDNDAAALEIANIDSVICDNFVLPFFIMKNQGTDPITAATIVYQYSNGIGDTIEWTGNIPPNAFQPIVFPIETLPSGVYSLTIDILDSNGQLEYRNLDNSISTRFSVSPAEPPVTTATNPCTNSGALLTATSSTPGTIVWYDELSGGNLLGTGSPFVTAPVSVADTFYANILTTNPTGLVDTAGTNSFISSATTGYLEFDAFQDFTLKQVTVYSEVNTTRLIELRDASGTTIGVKVAILDTGVQVVDLDFDVPPGIGHQLAINGFSKLAVSTSGLQYPYSVAGALSITGSSEGTDAYYFFYDWKVESEAICGRTMTLVNVIPGSFTASFSASTNAVDLNVSGTVQFTDETVGATNWAWDFGDGNTSTAQNPIHTYITPGTYTVALSATGSVGCPAATSTTIEVTGDIVSDLVDELEALGTIRLFPNPSTGIFTLTWETRPQYPVNIQVYDILGKAVYQSQYTSAAQPELQINLAEQADGVYYLHLETQGKKGVIKMLKSQ